MAVLLTKRGKPKFADNGYEYVQDRVITNGTIQTWRCERRNEHCKATLYTSLETGERMGVGKWEHNHDSNAAKVAADRVVTAIKIRAVETVETTSVLINQCVQGTSNAVQGQLPQSGALKKVVRRARQELADIPLNPLNTVDLDIPERFRTYSASAGQEERFMLKDSGQGANRIIIFGRQTWVQFLRDSPTWYMDGTFRAAPQIFQQVYIILCTRYGGVHPVLYALLPNKNRATYHRLFAMVNELVPNAHPQTISCDFEAGAFMEMEEAWPMAQIFVCLFHLAQNMRKALGRVHLLTRYNNEPEFQLQCKMVVALAFVPIGELPDAFDTLCDALPAELEPLTDWLEDNYIGRRNRRGNARRVPQYPMEMWNMYDRTLNDAERTNNKAEAANRHLNTHLQIDHPTIWQLIEKLRTIQSGRDVFLEGLVGGHDPPPKLDKYQKADKRIKKIVSKYRERDLIDYLRGISHNFNMHP